MTDYLAAFDAASSADRFPLVRRDAIGDVRHACRRQS
jgi:hypothetical protein